MLEVGNTVIQLLPGFIENPAERQRTSSSSAAAARSLPRTKRREGGLFRCGRSQAIIGSFSTLCGCAQSGAERVIMPRPCEERKINSSLPTGGRCGPVASLESALP